MRQEVGQAPTLEVYDYSAKGPNGQPAHATVNNPELAAKLAKDVIDSAARAQRDPSAHRVTTADFDTLAGDARAALAGANLPTQTQVRGK